MVLLWCASAVASAQSLSKQQAEVARLIDQNANAAVQLLETIVNINSGTYNPAGVIAVDKAVEPEFRALGFATRWINMDSVKRAPTLVAERKGSRGKRILVIGHTDTVFEKSRFALASLPARVGNRQEKQCATRTLRNNSDSLAIAQNVNSKRG